MVYLLPFLLVASAASAESQLIEVVYDEEGDIIHYKGHSYHKEIGLGSDNDTSVNMFFALLCVIGAALASGLTMGLVSIDPLDMKIIMETNEDDCPTDAERDELRVEKSIAAKVGPLVNRHHQLLVTLLLLNSLANEALPLFLNEVVSPAFAVGFSVTAVLIFGEIIPAAIFTGPNQLAIAAAMAPFVWFLVYLFWVIAYPFSIVLDQMLGEDLQLRYNKAKFRTLLNKYHHEQTDSEIGEDDETAEKSNILLPDPMHSGNRYSSQRSGIAKRELTIMQGALELYRVKCKDEMVTLDNVYMLSDQHVLDDDTLRAIKDSGHSRVPVYADHPHNIRGMILVKSMITLNPEDKIRVGSLDLIEPMIVHSDCTLLDLLYEFSEGVHLAIVASDPSRVAESYRTGTQIPVNVHMAGIITLEDVIERLIKHEINDETDIIVKAPASARRTFDLTQSYLSTPTNEPIALKAGHCVTPPKSQDLGLSQPLLQKEE